MQRALVASEAAPTEADVQHVLERFRKTILGLEKYRINNPGRVATIYNDVLKTCLAVPDCWGAAANALEYAGLVLRDHVVERPRADGGGGAILDATSLWTTACVRLLDVDVTSDHRPPPPHSSDPTVVGSSSDSSVSNGLGPSAEGSGTWDQKFFSQVELDDDGAAAIRDMMLGVLRVAVRALLSREADLAGPAASGPLGTVDVAVDEYAAGGGCGYLPPTSAAKLVLALDFTLLQEMGLDDEEGSDEALVAYLGADEDGGRAWDEVTLLRVCDRRCTAYPQRRGTDIFQFAPPSSPE